MSTTNHSCPICQASGASTERTNSSNMDVDCPRCGSFSITATALSSISKNIDLRQRFIMSSAIREMGDRCELDSRNIKELFKRKDKSPLDKLDLLLLHIYKEAEKAGSVFSTLKLELTKNSPQPASRDPSPSPSGYAMMSACWAINIQELYAMIILLRDQEYIVQLVNDSMESAKLTTKGLERVSTLQRDKGEGKQCFVAMWFHDDMQKVWIESLKPGIEYAGYEALRIDGKEHSNKIDDEIIMEIRRSRFLVADFTGRRGGVYFEAGFAKGLGLPVIWTCRDDEVKNLHFDIRQYNCLRWSPSDLPAFRTSLHRRIESILGHGPRREDEAAL